jgi:hypothetical protein
MWMRKRHRVVLRHGPRVGSVGVNESGNAMSTSSAAPARWREKTRIVVVDVYVNVFLTLLSFSALALAVFAWPDEPTHTRAVAAMVREDAREAMATLERHAVVADSSVFIDNSDLIINDADVIQNAPREFVFDIDGKRVMRIDDDGNIFITGLIYERGEKP